MKNFFAPFLLATVLAGSSIAAYAFSPADQYGSAATASFTGRTIVIDSHTRYINVMHGETVTIRKGASSITWYFDGIGSAFSLSKIMPAAAAAAAAAAAPDIVVYVAPELVG